MEISFAAYECAPMTVKTWALLNSLLITPKGEQVQLQRITQVSFVDERGRGGQWVTTLRLSTADESVKIFCSDRQEGEHRQRCFQLILAVLDRLTVVNSTVNIRLGYSRLGRYLFALGMMPALIFCTAMFVIGTQQLLQGINIVYVFFVLFAISGFISIIHSSWVRSPWRSIQLLSPAALQELIHAQLSMVGLP
mgnify:CR=1 FL=1